MEESTGPFQVKLSLEEEPGGEEFLERGLLEEQGRVFS